MTSELEGQEMLSHMIISKSVGSSVYVFPAPRAGKLLNPTCDWHY